MTVPSNDRRDISPGPTRGHLRIVWDVIFGALRFIGKYARNVYAVFGIFLLSGAAVAILLTWVFSEVADRVRAGSTQGFDDAVLRWLGAHQSPGIQAAMVEITSLGTSVVVTMIVFIAGLFL